MKPLVCFLLAFAALFHASCNHSESDGRVYHSNSSPLQGKMGVSFKRVPADVPPTAIGAAADPTAEGATAAAAGFDEPPGLMDRLEQPDEPGAEYWMHGQLSPNPVQSKMGVRVQRRKK